jgi:TrmH family RNA methyltransferase
MQNSISSLQNPLVKQILQLQEKSRTRKKLGLFVVEGIREITLAVKGGYQIDTLLFDASISNEEERKSLIEHALKTIAISKDVYKKLAYRTTTEGVIAVVKSKTHELSGINFSTENPLILVAEAPEKPGNIGALLRTADAANVDAVIIANPKTDLYNPNIIRSSVGCVFTNTIATGSTTEVIQFLKENNINIYGAALSASVNYTTIDYTQATAIIMGTEATGLTEEWLKSTTRNIIIPMQGEIDSMNVSVSAAILIFEAKRQRNFQ